MSLKSRIYSEWPEFTLKIYSLRQRNKICIPIFLIDEYFDSVFHLRPAQHQIQAKQGFRFDTRI